MAENKYLKKELSKYTQKNLTSSSIFSENKKENSRDILTNTGKNIISSDYNNIKEKRLFEKQMGNKKNNNFEENNFKYYPKNYSAQYSNNNLLNYNNIKPNKFKTTDNLKMLDEMEKQNILKTQALIQQISNSNRKNNKNINFSAPKSNPNQNKYKLNNINSYISDNDVNNFY
jgi:hypothetical protein